MSKTDQQKAIKKQQLRSQLHHTRQKASQKYSQQAHKNLAHQLLKLRVYRSAKHVAAYLPFKSEFPTKPIFNSNSKLKKQTYVPCITSIRKKQMRFVQLSTKIINCTKHGKLKKNAYGISCLLYTSPSPRDRG